MNTEHAGKLINLLVTNLFIIRDSDIDKFCLFECEKGVSL